MMSKGANEPYATNLQVNVKNPALDFLDIAI